MVNECKDPNCPVHGIDDKQKSAMLNEAEKVAYELLEVMLKQRGRAGHPLLETSFMLHVVTIMAAEFLVAHSLSRDVMASTLSAMTINISRIFPTIRVLYDNNLEFEDNKAMEEHATTIERRAKVRQGLDEMHAFVERVFGRHGATH